MRFDYAASQLMHSTAYDAPCMVSAHPCTQVYWFLVSDVLRWAEAYDADPHRKPPPPPKTSASAGKATTASRTATAGNSGGGVQHKTAASVAAGNSGGGGHKTAASVAAASQTATTASKPAKRHKASASAAAKAPGDAAGRKAAAAAAAKGDRADSVVDMHVSGPSAVSPSVTKASKPSSSRPGTSVVAAHAPAAPSSPQAAAAVAHKPNKRPRRSESAAAAAPTTLPQQLQEEAPVSSGSRDSGLQRDGRPYHDNHRLRANRTAAEQQPAAIKVGGETYLRSNQRARWWWTRGYGLLDILRGFRV